MGRPVYCYDGKKQIRYYHMDCGGYYGVVHYKCVMKDGEHVIPPSPTYKDKVRSPDWCPLKGDTDEQKRA